MVKSKVRFDGLDVAAMVAHWNRVALGRRVINIYNGPNGDTYLFKLDKNTSSGFGGAASGKSKAASNLMLLLESGIRFHTTNEAYENPGMPTPFCSKLRKHLRGLRLEQVQQLGQKDRVVMLTFGSGEAQRHTLILELYARGNLLLTNSQYTILSLLRSHDYDGAVKVQVGHAYPITYATTMTTATTPDATDASTTEMVASDSLLSSSNPLEWYLKHRKTPSPEATGNANQKGGKKKKGKNEVDGHQEWRNLLLQSESGVSHYGPSLIDHCLLCAGIATRERAPVALMEEEWKDLQSILQTEGDRIWKDLDLADAKGYIFYQPKLGKENATEKQSESNQEDEKKDEGGASNTGLFDDKLLMDFQPHILKQHEGLAKLEYDSFDGAADAFFAHIESQKRMLRAETQQAQAEQRLEKIKMDQQKRLDQLLHQQDVLREQAQLVETHADMVDKAIQVVNSALDSGMDWDQLEDLVQIEQIQNQNPVALLIHKLLLEEDAMILRLEKQDYNAQGGENNSVDASPTAMNVTISLKETAFGNASAMFAKYRASKEKGQKTIEASSKAIQAAEENAQRQLQDAKKRKNHLSNSLQTKRKPLWFEKFHWFITSDNYLAIAGRDAQQNEQIVKRYLRPGDAYLHADVHGAASCVLRAKRRRSSNGKTQTLPLSEQALRETGNFTICRSSAWTSRMVTSAWWVESHQVSKTAPTGEYLTVGSFMIRGKKNFLPPTQLELGLGVLFRLGDDEAIARHKNERRDFALMQLEERELELDESSFVEPPKSTQKTANSEDTAVPLVADEEEALQCSLTEEVKGSEAPETLSLAKEDEKETQNDFVSQDVNFQAIENTKIESDSGENATISAAETKEDDSIALEVQASGKQKKGLSVKERKLIKKYGSLEAAQAAEDERKQKEEAKKSRAQPKTKVPQPAATMKRGKKAKMKKIAKKYADQDEEDRKLAMTILHDGEKAKKKDKQKEPEISETAKAAAAQTMAILNKDSSVIAETLPSEVKEILAKCVTVQNSGADEGPTVRWDKFDFDVLEQVQSFELDDEKLAAAKRLLSLKESTRVDNFSASLAGIIRTIRKYGHQGILNSENNSDGQDAKRKTKAEKVNEQESWKQTLAEEGILDAELDDDGVDDTTELSKLTGKPVTEDSILFAVPVCAPYQTLSQYSYRVKLTPGNMKRGKASKACLEMFLKDGQKTSLSQRSQELIKRVADNEWVQAITGDVKISAAGASKAIQKQKSKSKPKKKK